MIPKILLFRLNSLKRWDPGSGSGMTTYGARNDGLKDEILIDTEMNSGHGSE
jgi:hypothetical protein